MDSKSNIIDLVSTKNRLLENVLYQIDEEVLYSIILKVLREKGFDVNIVTAYIDNDPHKASEKKYLVEVMCEDAWDEVGKANSYVKAIEKAIVYILEEMI